VGFAPRIEIQDSVHCIAVATINESLPILLEKHAENHTAAKFIDISSIEFLESAAAHLRPASSASSRR
jgi:hypothetical protein